MKYYLITCHRGHAGTKHSTDIKFAIKANTLIDACSIAKRMPSVKHTRAIAFGKEITFEEYTEYRQISAYERFADGRGY